MLAIVAPMAQWLGSSNSCINPILYAFFNKKYRNGFLAIVKSRSCCGSLRYDACSYSTTRRSYYPSYRSTVRPEAGGATFDSIGRHKPAGAGNIYTVEGRGAPRTRYHPAHSTVTTNTSSSSSSTNNSAIRSRSALANGLSPALHLADLAHDTDHHKLARPTSVQGGIEVVEVDDHNGYSDAERAFPNGKLDAVD